MKKLDALIEIYSKGKINDKTDIQILEINEYYIVFKYKDVLIKAFINKKEYKRFVKNHYSNKEIIREYDVITFLTKKELVDFLRGTYE